MSEDIKAEMLRDQARRISYQRRDIDRMKRQIEDLRIENAHLRAMQPEPLKRMNEEVCDENDRLRAEVEALRASRSELLKALRQIVDQHGQWNNGIWAANLARAAIAKAEAGKSTGEGNG